MLLPRVGENVELVIGQLFREPVAAVIREGELLRLRVPVEADRVADPARDDLDVGAVEVHPADLRVRVRRNEVVARRADGHVELIVGTNLDELPAMGLVLGEIVIDEHRSRRLVEVGLDIGVFGDLRDLRDVERPILERDAVGPMQTLGDDLHLALAVDIRHGVDAPGDPGADKDRTLVAHLHGAAVGEARCIDLELESVGEMQLVQGKLVERRCRDRHRHRLQGQYGLVGGLGAIDVVGDDRWFTWLLGRDRFGPGGSSKADQAEPGRHRARI